MLKVKFRNGASGTLVDWTPYMVIQEVGVIKRSVESENPGEAGLIVYDNVSLSFRYEYGNVVYEAFSVDLSTSQLYFFEIYALKSNKEEVKLFEGIADFTTIEWDLNEKTIRFDVVDKIKALDLLTDTETQRGNLTDAITRINAVDYLYDIIKRIITGSGVWLEIQTYILINNEGTLERGDEIPHSQVILQKGEIFNHPDENVGLCLVTDSELMTSMGGWQTTFIKIHPVKACRLALPMYSADSIICVTGNIFNQDDVIYLERNSQIEFVKILNEGFGSEISWIYNVERHYTGGIAYDWNQGEIVNFSDERLTYITNLSSPPATTHLWYYSNSYYSLPDINIFGLDLYNRNVLNSFDALKIIRAIAAKTLSPLIFINRTGAASFPVSLNYYTKLYGASPFGKHSVDALKLLTDSMKCYIFIDKEGSLVIQKKSNLGEPDNGAERVFDSARLSAASVPRKYFWDKIIDGIEARVTSDGYLNSTVSKQIFTNLKPRNELTKEIVALNTVEFTPVGLAEYAGSIADDYLNFYGKRHESYSVSISLYDDLLDWELLDYTSINGHACFFAGFEIDITGREFNIELITVEGENYYKGQANIPLSMENYNKASGSGSDTGTAETNILLQGNIVSYSAEEPLVIDSSLIKLEYEDNLKLSLNNKLDTAQGIKVISSPQFAGIAIGGVIDENYKAKIYGSAKVTGNITIDGDINISGNINEVNVTELNIADKTIRLNKGGSDSTAVDSGIKILGSSDLTVASIIYDSNNNWSLNKNINLVSGTSYKINNTEVLTGTTLGAGIVNSSLTKVGTLMLGIWNATPVNGQYLNYNPVNFQVISNQLSSKAITAASNNGIIVSGVFNLGGAITIDTPQDIRISASPVFNNITLNNGYLNSNADLTINLSGNSILPLSGYAYSIGSLSKKFLSLHAAELWVETLVAQNSKATIGGRVLIGETNELTADLSAASNYINVKYNSFSTNDIIYLEANSKIEFMKVLSLISSETENYEYQVQRNLDGTGANQWYGGDAVFNTGNIGDGFIDLYSIKGIKGASQPGPAISGNVRNSLTFNDWTEHWAIGNLNGLYGYTSNHFGAGFGKYANNSCYVTIDSENGFAIRHKSSSGTEVKVIELDTGGNGYFRGNITSSAVITGGIIQSASSGKRVRIDAADNDIKFYNDLGEYISVEGYLSAGNEKRLHIGGTIIGDSDIWISGTGLFSNKIRTTKYFDAAEGYKIDELEIIDENRNAYLNFISGEDINASKYKLLGELVIDAAPAASKILVSDANKKIVASAISSSELMIPAFAELYDATASSTIVCDGTTYVKWTNASIGITKSIEGSTSSDCIVISSGHAGKYEARFDVSFKVDYTGDYLWGIKVGSEIIQKSRVYASVNSVNVNVPISGGCLLNLAEGDLISIGCFGGSGKVVTVTYVNLKVIKKSN